MARLLRVCIVWEGVLLDISVLASSGAWILLHRDLIGALCSMCLAEDLATPLLVVLVAAPSVHEVVHNCMTHLTVATESLIVDIQVTLLPENRWNNTPRICIAQFLHHCSGLLCAFLWRLASENLCEPRAQTSPEFAAHQISIVGYGRVCNTGKGVLAETCKAQMGVLGRCCCARRKRQQQPH